MIYNAQTDTFDSYLSQTSANYVVTKLLDPLAHGISGLYRLRIPEELNGGASAFDYVVIVFF